MEDIKTLWHNYKNNNDSQAKALLIEEYIRLVKFIAGRLYISYGSNIEYDDLVSYGIFGLIDAIEKFDLNKQVKFETYAQIRIRGAIIDSLRSLDWVPRSIRQKSKKIEEAYSSLENKLGRSATDVEVSEALDISVKELQEILLNTASFNVISLEEVIFEVGLIGNTAEEQLTEDLICRRETYNNLKDTIVQLPERERQVISLYYYNNLTYKEIGKVLDISESRVSQLHSKAISRLKSKLTSNSPN
ncbi:FliA/WhiG family RNA polymerase sigma factor [Alkaliphilus oremlandii]|uniref:RNA polymerase sigma factor n=1 Tax=Alkaliphilus oremlandii (strain OhILAs) TaxID=350688 RepID=A8MHG6_ALKOO|nr:FliA/WhiG family RNA polymerase sigma factor [Alkaliphilus oremlandii]ABW19053.1 RNA polymerase, sigma 28 subunit, FliA/WhiG [Alkaliphilus oremlandii OhILAs]